MEIFYGTSDYSIKVSSVCLEKFQKNGVIQIPVGEFNRSLYFSDPCFGQLKRIFISTANSLRSYDHTKEIFIVIETSSVYVDEIPYFIREIYPYRPSLDTLHSTLNLNYGSFRDEFPEQRITHLFLTGNEKVLEIGGNIGRNSLIIASILKTNDFVSLECSTLISKQLEENRDSNNFKFHIENSALSKRRLLQKEWDTIPSEEDLPEYTLVNNITFEELRNKYNIDFDTLIADCEGALYYIFTDMPEMLDNIKLIIMENDYLSIDHKKYVDRVLVSKGFSCVYTESGGWGCCYNNFYEVWKKD
jgi:FkbM family methyltransferase